MVLHLATAVALAGSPSAFILTHEGKVCTCSQQVLQERLAIGTVTRGERTGKRRLSAKSQPLRGRILLRTGVPFHLQARKQEGLRFQGLISNRFLGEWTYLLGLASGWCRGHLAIEGLFLRAEEDCPKSLSRGTNLGQFGTTLTSHHRHPLEST